MVPLNQVCLLEIKLLNFQRLYIKFLFRIYFSMIPYYFKIKILAKRILWGDLGSRWALRG